MKKVTTCLLSTSLLASALFLTTTDPTFAKSSKSSISVQEAEIDGIKPDMVEMIEQNGQTIPVYYFDDNDRALRYMEAKHAQDQRIISNFDKEPSRDSKSNSIQAANKITYQGTIKKDYTNTFVANRTNQEQSMSTQVKRSHSSQVNGKVSLDAFAKWFKAEVGYAYTNTYEYANTFNLKVPAQKKGMITTYNYADYWTGDYSGASFWVSRPTTTEGSELYIVNLDFPEN